MGGIRLVREAVRLRPPRLTHAKKAETTSSEARREEPSKRLRSPRAETPWKWKEAETARRLSDPQKKRRFKDVAVATPSDGFPGRNEGFGRTHVKECRFGGSRLLDPVGTPDGGRVCKGNMLVVTGAGLENKEVS